MTQIETNLLAASEVLRTDARWCVTLAENLICTSCEGLLQSSLLGAFNTIDVDNWADRERHVAYGECKFQPDLIVLKRENYRRWWNTTDRVQRVATAEALVQAKLVWTLGNAWASATLPCKVKEIVKDAGFLRAVRQGNLSCEHYLVTLISGSHPPGEWEDAFAHARTSITDGLREAAIHVSPHQPIVFLRDYHHPFWAAARGTDRRVNASLLWLRVES